MVPRCDVSKDRCIEVSRSSGARCTKLRHHEGPHAWESIVFPPIPGTHHARRIMMRTIADLTDDEIVDAIASYGIAGVDWSPDANEGVDDVLARLGIDNSGEERIMLRVRAADMRDVHGARLRWCDGYDCFMMGLSHSEWARRLAHRSAEDIARMLAGEA